MGSQQEMESKEEAMWENLPVVVLPDWTLGQEELLETLQKYVMSEHFLKTGFRKGWESLFLGYWRKRILQDAEREDFVLSDTTMHLYIFSRTCT